MLWSKYLIINISSKNNQTSNAFYWQIQSLLDPIAPLLSFGYSNIVREKNSILCAVIDK